jgi:selenocysteine-specific elongation factor
MIYPSKEISKVRGIQVHNQSVEVAEAGMRTAINFQGLDKADVQRGDIIAAPDALVPSYMVDVALHYLPGNTKPLKNRAQVRFHTGTSEILGVVVLLDRDELLPGEQSLAQIRLEAPVTLVKDDRYVLRSYSPVRTIGGGPVLNPLAPKHKSNKPEVVQQLSALTGEGATEETLQQQIEQTGFAGCAFHELLIISNLPEKQLERMLQALMSKHNLLQIDKEKRRFVHQRAFIGLQTAVQEQLRAYHQSNPLKPGMPKEELKSRLPDSVDIKLFALVLQQMIKAEKIVAEEEIVRLATHRVALGVDQRALRETIVSTYHKAGLTPPYFKELCAQQQTPLDQARQVMALLVDEGVMVKVKEDLYYHRQPLDELKQKLVTVLIRQTEISTPQFKDMTGVSRKYVIPLLEYFDATQLTIRVGDLRKLRKRPVQE